MKKAITSAVLGGTALLSTSILAGGSSSSGGRLAMVTYWGDDTVALLDLQGSAGTEEIWAIDVLKQAGCPKPYDVRVDSKGAKAYATCSGGDTIISIDIVAQMVEWQLKTGKSPRDLQIYDDDKKILVANSGSDTVSVVDIDEKKVLYDVPVSAQPYGVALADDGKIGLITGWASGDLHILELGESSGRTIGRVDVGMLPYTVVAPNGGKLAYVAANADHAVVAVDIKKKKVLAVQQVGRNPWSIATDPNGSKLLVANNRSGDLSLIGLGGFNGLSAFPTPRSISAGYVKVGPADTVTRAAKNVAISTDTNTGVFTDLANNQVVVVDLESGDIVKSIDVGKAPYGIELIRAVDG